MKARFISFRRGKVYYCEDTLTGKQQSLKTKDEAEALSLLNAKNESFRQPALNLQIARAYLTAADPASPPANGANAATRPANSKAPASLTSGRRSKSLSTSSSYSLSLMKSWT